MEVHQDFSEWLALLNEHEVEYIIIGAHAMAFYGVPRYTGDIDIFVRPSQTNASRIMNVFNAFGFGDLAVNESDFLKPENVIQLGYPPVRIDLITSITGVSWEETDKDAVDGNYGDVPVRFISLEKLVQNKRACGRMKDLADIEALNE